MNHHLPVFRIVIAIALSMTTGTSYAVIEYEVTDIGIGSSLPLAINNDGFVVGGVGQPFVWHQKLGLRVFDNPDENFAFEATDINDQGQILITRSGGISDRPYLWDPVQGRINIPLHTATSLNNLGQVGGRATSGRPAIWSSTDGITVLPTLRGGTSAVGFVYDINDDSIAVGTVPGLVGTSLIDKAVKWKSNSGLTELFSGPSIARSINNKGVVVLIAGGSAGFLVNPAMNDSIVRLPFGSFAMDINDYSQVIVGRSNLLWHPDTGTIDLSTRMISSSDNSSGSAYSSIAPTAINNRGQMVGRSQG